MDRLIKFRGLRVDGKGWVYGSLITTCGECEISDESCIVGSRFDVNPESVGQLLHTEKNGRQWWEGDKAEIRSVKHIGEDEYGDNSEIDQTYTGTVCMNMRSGLSIKIESIFCNNVGEEVPFTPNQYKTIVFYRSDIISNIHQESEVDNAIERKAKED